MMIISRKTSEISWDTNFRLPEADFSVDAYSCLSTEDSDVPPARDDPLPEDPLTLLSLDCD